jgi:hypothetical protein
MPADGKDLSEKFCNQPELLRAQKRVASSDHTYHAIHHKLTMKTPRFASAFSQNTPQTPEKQPQKKSASQFLVTNPPTRVLT